MSVPDIVKKVLRRSLRDRLRVALSGTYPPREYCVQYRETTSTSCRGSRGRRHLLLLRAHEGKHTMVLADSPTAIKSGPVAEAVGTSRGGRARTRDDVHRGARDRAARSFTGSSDADDYNFETPVAESAREDDTTVKGGRQLGSSSATTIRASTPSVHDGERLARAPHGGAARRSSVTVAGRGDRRGASRVRHQGRQSPTTIGATPNKPYLVLGVAHTARHGSYPQCDGRHRVSRSSTTFEAHAARRAVTARRASRRRPIVRGVADRGRRRPSRRGDLRRQVRPREGAVLSGIARARRTRTARAGCASRARGPASSGASSTFRASDRK